MSERHFQLVLAAQPVTCSLPARIQCLTRHNTLKLFFIGLHEANLYNFFEMAIGDFSNSELFMHTAKNQLCLLNAEKHLHFDLKSVSICYFNIDLRMS